MRHHYDSQGRYRGSSQSTFSLYFWNGTLTGIFLSCVIWVFALPFVATAAIWRSRMNPWAKVGLTALIWGGLVALGSQQH